MNDQTRSASDYNSGATDDMHGLVGAYALNAVSETERTAFEAHLDVCGQCREELASFGSVIDSLADDADGDADVVLPAGLAERIAAEIAVTEQVTPSLVPLPASDGDTADLPKIEDEIAAGPTSDFDVALEAASDNVVAFERTHANPAGRRSRLPMLLAAAAATIAVAAVGVGFIITGGSPDANVASVDQVLNAPDAHTIALGVGDTEITVSDEVGGFAATGNAPALDEDLEYQLWLVNADGTIDPGPTFQAGHFKTAVIEDLSGVNAIAVSVEPAGGSEQPTTDPIATVEL